MSDPRTQSGTRAWYIQQVTKPERDKNQHLFEEAEDEQGQHEDVRLHFWVSCMQSVLRPQGGCLTSHLLALAVSGFWVKFGKSLPQTLPRALPVQRICRRPHADALRASRCDLRQFVTPLPAAVEFRACQD